MSVTKAASNEKKNLDPNHFANEEETILDYNDNSKQHEMLIDDKKKILNHQVGNAKLISLDDKKELIRKAR
jgi:hypothetical protein